MAKYSDNHPLLINTFQDSLSGAALSWYTSLDVEKLQTWDDLSTEFQRHYRFNIEVPLTREDLARTQKRTHEEIRKYAQRWMVVASQVKPPVQDEELIDLFLKALPADYYEKMHTTSATSFTALVKIAERIETVFNDKKKLQEAERRAYPRRGKEIANEIAFVSQDNSGPTQNVRFQTQTWKTSKPYESPRKITPRQYTPLPRPLSQLLPMLLEGRLVSKEVPRKSPPKFKEFDLSKSCEYHMGERGHNVDNCLALRNKLQDLIDRGMIDFKEPEPNVHQNPLPDHQVVNVVLNEDGCTAAPYEKGRAGVLISRDDDVPTIE